MAPNATNPLEPFLPYAPWGDDNDNDNNNYNSIHQVGFDCNLEPKNPFNNQDFLSTNHRQSFPDPSTRPLNMCLTMNQTTAKKEKPFPSSLSSLKLLQNYPRGTRLNGRKLNNSNNEKKKTPQSRTLSTEELIRIAGTRYIQISDNNQVGNSLMLNPMLLDDQDSRDVELLHSLLASAEKIGSGLYDRACKLLLQCDHLSSNTGNPIQRLVHYFSDALRERVDRQTGHKVSDNVETHARKGMDEEMTGFHPSILAFHQALPICQILQLTQIQTILDSVGSSTKIHIIDLGIRTGMHWTALMQALSQRPGPLELLKITAIGKSQENISESGKRLVSFADALNLPFEFKMIISDMEELKEEMFGVDGGSESLVVYSQTVLRSMICTPCRLEKLMRVIRNLKPLVMTVGEIEANHNSPCFLDRFIEALFFYGASFDALETCMDRLNKDRLDLEATFWAAGIRNIVACEGSERLVRHVEIDVWRSFITRFGFQEMELSEACMYQASLIVKRHVFGGFCTLGKKGKALTVGWKGTALHSVSAWKCC